MEGQTSSKTAQTKVKDHHTCIVSRGGVRVGRGGPNKFKNRPNRKKGSSQKRVVTPVMYLSRSRRVQLAGRFLPRPLHLHNPLHARPSAPLEPSRKYLPLPRHPRRKCPHLTKPWEMFSKCLRMGTRRASLRVAPVVAALRAPLKHKANTIHGQRRSQKTRVCHV